MEEVNEGFGGVLPDDILDEQPPEVNIAIKDENGEVTGFRSLKPLSLREALFVREYIKDFDNKAVGKRMNLKQSQVHGLLARKNVRSEIQKKAQEHFAVLDMDTHWVLKNIRDVVERCMDDERFDASNALRGLELVGKRHALFTDKVEVNQKTVIRIESNIGNVLDGVIDVIDVTPVDPRLANVPLQFRNTVNLGKKGTEDTVNLGKKGTEDV